MPESVNLTEVKHAALAIYFECVTQRQSYVAIKRCKISLENNYGMGYIHTNIFIIKNVQKLKT